MEAKICVFIAVVILFISGFFIFGQKISAANSNIIINEIGAYPTSTHEWIEIWNKGDEAVDLNDWKFWENNVNHSLSVSTTDSVVAPGEYAVICQSDWQFALDYPNFLGSIFDSAWTSLNESGEEIGLKDGGGNFIEKFSYVSASNHSLERRDPFLSDHTSANWQENLTGNTVGAVNSNFFVNSTSAPFVTSTASTTSPVPTSTPAATPTSTSSSTSPLATTTTLNATSAIWARIKINEFVSDPASGDEWVELFNPTTSSLDLAGGAICDSRTSTSCIATTTAGIIVANGWAIFSWSASRLNNDADSVILKDPGGIIVDQIEYGAGQASVPAKGRSLVRKIDGQDMDSASDWAVTISLSPNATNTIVAPPAPQPYSSGGGGGSASSFYSKVTSAATTTPPIGATATSTTFMPTSTCVDIACGASTTTVPAIILYRLFPDPPGWDSDDEFIELKNISSGAVELQGWKLADLSKKFVLTGALGAGQIIRLMRKVTNLSLNNATREEVKLYNQFGALVDKIGYDKAPEGEILARDGDEWLWIKGGMVNNIVGKKRSSSSSTAGVASGEDSEESDGEEGIVLVIDDSDDGSAGSGLSKKVVKAVVNKGGNKQAKEANQTKKASKVVYESLTLTQARETEKGDGVRVRGRVSAPPGIFGVQYFYIFDGQSGIQVYMYKKDFPKLAIGDHIEIAGVISEASGVKRIKIKDKTAIDILATNGRIEPLAVNLGGIDEQTSGALVKTTGVVMEVKSNLMYIDDGEDEITVYFKKGAKIDKKKIREGEEIEVVGVLEQKASGWQIWPRADGDIKSLGFSDYSFEKQQQIGAAKNDEKEVAEKYLTATAGGITTLFLGLLARARGALVRNMFKRVAAVAVGLIKKNRG